MSTTQIILIVVFGISLCHGFRAVVLDEVLVDERELTITVVYEVVQGKDSHSIKLQVNVRSTILDVMEEAQKGNSQYFKFAKEDTAWGWYITAIGGTKAEPADRTYWEFLVNNEPITVGVAMYKVKADDLIIAKFSTY